MNTKAAALPLMNKMRRTGPVTTERSSSVHKHRAQPHSPGSKAKQSAAAAQLRHRKNPEPKHSFWVKRQIVCAWGSKMGLDRAVRACLCMKDLENT